MTLRGPSSAKQLAARLRARPYRLFAASESRRRSMTIGAGLLLVVSLGACGSRLSGGALQAAKGSSSATGSGTAGSAGGAGVNGSAGSATSGAAGAGAGGATAAAGGGGAASGGAASGAAGGSGGGASGTLTSASCNASNNGGATDVGITANSITVGNITSISGVAPGLTQSAQAATEALAAYVNSQGGICGRQLKVQTFDDGNDTGNNAADAQQACKSDFAMVGNASGFDNGGASAIQSCGIPDVAAELSTHEMGDVPNAFGASPGNAHYWPTGPAVWLKSQFPNAVTHAAMIYLNVPATQEQAQAEMQAYQSVGFNYVYTVAVSPTEPNYAPYVAKMQSDGVQYVTEYSDDNSASRLVQAMAQANYHPQVVDWFAEEYSPHFLSQAQGDADGDLVLMATSPYEEASSNPGMQLFLSWLNRVAPGTTHDIFGEFAWSAGLAFLQAAQSVGPHLTRAALLAALQKIGQWNGGGVQPTDQSFGQKIPSQCFAYFKIAGNGFTRVYPSQPNSFDCNSGGLTHY
jgi:ABC-type branched-subunit amino acid transport system substrate-binding protein